jgi:hypothetical protein
MLSSNVQSSNTDNQQPQQQPQHNSPQPQQQQQQQQQLQDTQQQQQHQQKQEIQQNQQLQQQYQLINPQTPTIQLLPLQQPQILQYTHHPILGNIAQHTQIPIQSTLNHLGHYQTILQQPYQHANHYTQLAGLPGANQGLPIILQNGLHAGQHPQLIQIRQFQPSVFNYSPYFRIHQLPQ